MTARILKQAKLITVNSQYTYNQIKNNQNLANKIIKVYPCPNIHSDKIDSGLLKRIKKDYQLEIKDSIKRRTFGRTQRYAKGSRVDA